MKTDLCRQTTSAAVLSRLLRFFPKQKTTNTASKLFSKASYEERLAWASTSDCKNALIFLARDPDPVIQSALRSNPNFMPIHIKQMVDEVMDVFNQLPLSIKLKSIKQCCHPEVLRALADYENVIVKLAVLNNPNTPTDVCDKLAAAFQDLELPELTLSSRLGFIYHLPWGLAKKVELARASTDQSILEQLYHYSLTSPYSEVLLLALVENRNLHSDLLEKIAALPLAKVQAAANSKLKWFVSAMEGPEICSGEDED
ncbi:MAG: hypothetical protein ABIH50_07900 [bacterium]